ncbi:hypothetical protein FRB93_010540 [Tulasnella sp. JGI-2019a]|nr:hypothetical protein FRB93_010540 [Tulasnella sp. JGI-2019a]
MRAKKHSILSYSVRDLLKSDTPISAAHVIRNSFLVGEGDEDGPVERYEKRWAPEWKAIRGEVPPISEDMMDEIDQWVKAEASPRAVWWMLQLMYPAQCVYHTVADDPRN